MQTSIVLYDTNAYREEVGHLSASDAARRGAETAAQDLRRGIQPLLNPIVGLELIARFATTVGAEADFLHASICFARSHCAIVGATRDLGLMNDPESGLCRALFNAIPYGAHEVTIGLGDLIHNIADSDPHSARSNFAIGIEHVRSHVESIEDQFSQDLLNVVRNYDSSIESWATYVPTPSIRIAVRAMLEDPAFLQHLAEKQVEKSAMLLDVTPIPLARPRLHTAVLECLGAGVHLYRSVLRRILLDGARVIKAKHKNWVWDLQIALFASAMTQADRALMLVTGDRAIADAARDAGHADRVLSLAEYLAWRAERTAGS